MFSFKLSNLHFYLSLSKTIICNLWLWVRGKAGGEGLFPWEQQSLWLKESRKAAEKVMPNINHSKGNFEAIPFVCCTAGLISPLSICAQKKPPGKCSPGQHLCQRRTCAVARETNTKNKHHWKCFWEEATTPFLCACSLSGCDLWQKIEERGSDNKINPGSWAAPHSWVWTAPEVLVINGEKKRLALFFSRVQEVQKICIFDASQIQQNREEFEFCSQATFAVSVFPFICASGFPASALYWQFIKSR